MTVFGRGGGCGSSLDQTTTCYVRLTLVVAPNLALASPLSVWRRLCDTATDVLMSRLLASGSAESYMLVIRGPAGCR